MKKIIMFSIMLLGLLVFNNNVKAACGAGATVGGDWICLVTGATEGNSAGTAYAESSVLVLNNYNGGSIKFSSVIGTPAKEEIKLIGDNYITSEDGYGILSLVTGVNFVGNGTLTIKSKMPFLSYDPDRAPESYNFDNNEVSIIKITVGETKVNIEESKPADNDVTTEIKDETNNEKEEVKVEENNNLIVIALVVSLCVSVLCLIVMIGLVAKNNKSKKVNE